MEAQMTNQNEVPKQNDNYIANDNVPRMKAHEYENKIQELLEKIDILESRLRMTSEQKVKVVTQLKNFEDENEMLKQQISRQNDANKKLNMDRNKFEKQIQELQISNRSLNDKAKKKFEILNKELEEKESEMDKLNQQLKSKDETIKNFTVNNELTQKYSNTYKDELQEQKQLNKKQSDKISELEKQIDQLYIQRQTEGSLLLEIEHLKDDNFRLLQMLKSTEEFKDFAYLSETVPGGIRFLKETATPRKSATVTGLNTSTLQNLNTSTASIATARKAVTGKAAIPNSSKDILNNENWVPSEAYTFAVQFKNKYNLDLNENILNTLLTSLNKIWQEREKKQINRLKSQYQSEIMSLRRKVAMRSGYNEFTAQKTISKLKQDLKQTRDDLRDNIVLNNKLKTSPVGIDLVDNALKVASSFQNTKKCLENEIENLKRQLAQKEEKYHGTHQYYNQGCYWMAKKANEEVELLDKTIDDLYNEYEERVRNSNLMTGQNDLMDYNLRVVNNSVKWFFNTLKDMISSMKEKFNNWKYDTQKNLDILKANAKTKY